jgi:RNA polymerase sigma-70 factor (ECF subfamily)
VILRCPAAIPATFDYLCARDQCGGLPGAAVILVAKEAEVGVGDDHKITPHDAAELAACFKDHARRLFGFACVLARGDQALAGDLVQATFEAAARAWQTLRGLAEEQLRGWLRSTLANIAASGLRREAAFGDRLPQLEERHLDTPADPCEQAFPPIALERCWRVIKEMPNGQHVVAVLRWQLGMKEAEIAAVLGIAESTVSAQLDRARHKLIEQLGPDHPFARDDPEGESS